MVAGSADVGSTVARSPDMGCSQRRYCFRLQPWSCSSGAAASISAVMEARGSENHEPFALFACLCFF